MVYFIGEASSIHRITDTIGKCYPELVRIVRFVEYSQLLSLDQLPAGTYVFTGTIDFDPDRRQLAILVEKRLREWVGKFRILNSPFLSRGTGVRVTQLAREPLTTIGSLPSGETAFVEVCRPGSRGMATTKEELATALSSLLLDRIEPSQIALFPAETVASQVLIYGKTCLPLSGRQVIQEVFADSFGLDVFSVEFSDSETLIAISDRLSEILPMTPPGSPLSAAVTKAVLEMDTVRCTDSVPIGVSWHSLATAIGLKSSS